MPHGRAVDDTMQARVCRHMRVADALHSLGMTTPLKEPSAPHPSQIVTLGHWARSIGVSHPLAGRWARQGRLTGAYQASGRWLLPADTARPEALKPGGLTLWRTTRG